MDVASIIRVVGGRESCRVCARRSRQRFEELVNHYLREHGFKLLHVGQESARNNDGEIVHFTMAIIGVPPMS